MTFIELLSYIGAHSKYDIMDGDINQTLTASLAGKHKNAVIGNIIAQIYRNSGITQIDEPLVRAQAVKTLGPIRLFYMKDDAPVEGFRLVEDIVHKIDGAFNDEAMRLKK